MLSQALKITLHRSKEDACRPLGFHHQCRLLSPKAREGSISQLEACPLAGSKELGTRWDPRKRKEAKTGRKNTQVNFWNNCPPTSLLLWLTMTAFLKRKLLFWVLGFAFLKSVAWGLISYIIFGSTKSAHISLGLDDFASRAQKEFITVGC